MKVCAVVPMEVATTRKAPFEGDWIGSNGGPNTEQPQL